MLSKDFGTLLEIQYALTRLTDMRLTDKGLSEKIMELQEKGMPVFALTSRGPDVATATLRELSDQSLDLSQTAPHHDRFQSHPSPAYDSPQDLQKYRFVKRKPNLAKKSRSTAYKKGVFHTSGMDKGIMLRLMLDGWDEAEKIKAIVFVDDHHKHVRNMLWAMQDVPAHLVVVHYRGEDKWVEVFNEDKTRRQKTFQTLKNLKNACKTRGKSLNNAFIDVFGEKNITSERQQDLCAAIADIGFKNPLK